eukprot:SAG22_NODE_2706_length_2296_cov_2.034137_2_plen_67_part_01
MSELGQRVGGQRIFAFDPAALSAAPNELDKPAPDEPAAAAAAAAAGGGGGGDDADVGAGVAADSPQR